MSAMRFVSAATFSAASGSIDAAFARSMTVTPSPSPTTRSPGWTLTPPIEIGWFEPAGNELGRAVRIEAGGVHRQAERADRLGVAHRAVDDDGDDADRDGLLAHDLAHQRAVQVALAVDDDDVARLRDRERGVDHQVVAGADLDRQRRAGEAHRRRERARCGR